MGPGSTTVAPERVTGKRLRSLAATVADIVRARSQLFSCELQEELQRRGQLLALIMLAGACLHAALFALTVLLVVIFWDTYRIEVICVACGIYLAGGIALGLLARAQLAQSAQPFAASLRELRRDLAAFGGSP